ncbi:MAG TPA: nitroreductase/quinone reductase family protein [Solirubrobacteraceae bacterium]|jgi:hypothetical protein|nr:nitroreductase/quinone reductase family protein [Solirubrobacteraceae bacterium]
MSHRPLSRRIQARVMRVVNVPMRRVLALPVSTPLGERLMLAHIVGRRSGRHYRQPLSYVREGTTLLTPGGGNWKLNLREDEPVRLRLQGSDVQARPEIVSDAQEIERLLASMARANPGVARFAPAGDGLPTAVRQGFRVIRWHLDAA